MLAAVVLALVTVTAAATPNPCGVRITVPSSSCDAGVYNTIANFAGWASCPGRVDMTDAGVVASSDFMGSATCACTCSSSPALPCDMAVWVDAPACERAAFDAAIAARGFAPCTGMPEVISSAYNQASSDGSGSSLCRCSCPPAGAPPYEATSPCGRVARLPDMVCRQSAADALISNSVTGVRACPGGYAPVALTDEGIDCACTCPGYPNAAPVATGGSPCNASFLISNNGADDWPAGACDVADTLALKTGYARCTGSYTTHYDPKRPGSARCICGCPLSPPQPPSPKPSPPSPPARPPPPSPKLPPSATTRMAAVSPGGAAAVSDGTPVEVQTGVPKHTAKPWATTPNGAGAVAGIVSGGVFGAAVAAYAVRRSRAHAAAAEIATTVVTA